MTAVPEAFLAREAGMSYATMAHVTDYDVWHETEAPVTVDMVVRQLLANADQAKAAVVNAVRALRDAPPTPHADALRDAIITSRTAISPTVVARLKLLVGPYL
jgi:5'-methylthioadenosine phosphorylase